MTSLEGQLLIASPALNESPIRRAVVLVLEHSDEGALGVILNSPINEKMKSAANRTDNRRQTGIGPNTSDELGEVPLGTVAQNHSAGSIPQFDRIPTDSETVYEVEFQLPPGVPEGTPCRVFVGHTDWDRGQLEREVAEGLWLTIPAKPEYIFNDYDDLWIALIREKEKSFLYLALNISEVPDDPSIN